MLPWKSCLSAPPQPPPDAAYAALVAGGAYQKMRLTVVQDAAMLKKISDTYRKEGVKADMLFGAPTLILVSGDKSFDFRRI